MLTVRKVGLVVGDEWNSVRMARYVLEEADAPAAFAALAHARYQTAAEVALAPDKANVVWLGSERTLGLLGVQRGAAVSEAELAMTLLGRHAVTGEQLRRPGYRRVPGPDVGPDGSLVMVTEARITSVELAASAPKSVSVVWSQASPELRDRIEQAMIVSTNRAVEYLTSTKPVVQGDRTPAAGFAASAALQVTARTAHGDRVPAPQLHVHVQIVGVQDDKGTLRTPDSAAFYKDGAMLEGGAVFRAVLAQELRTLGFELDWGTGRKGRFFEIRGVPEALIERMSPRTAEVERMRRRMEQEGGAPLTGRAAAAVALKSRAPKSKDVTAQEMQQVWDEAAARLGFGPEAVEALRARGILRRPPEELRAQAREAILARIWERGPTVSAGEARAIAFEVAPMGLGVEDAARQLAQLQQAGEVIALEGGRVTTSAIRAREREVMDTAVRAAQSGGPALPPAAVAQGIAIAEADLGGGRVLLPEQRAAIEALTQGADWATLTGRAGTGKGPVLQAVAAAHQAAGWRVIAGAVDGATAERLGEQIGAPALTIARIMAHAGDGPPLDPQTLILIDEASKAGLPHWDDVAGLVRSSGARLRAVGHTGQLGAIELPGMFDEMLAHPAIPTVTLTTIMRHRNAADEREPHPWLGEYQVMLDEGHGHDAVALLRREDAITLRDTVDDAIEGMLDGWDERRRRYDDPRDAILVVHGSNADVDRVNTLAQERRLEAGDLGADGEHTAPVGVRAADRAYSLYVGDVVMFRDTAYRFEAAFGGEAPRRVENGTIGIVDSVDVSRGRVRVRVHEPAAEERIVDIDVGRLRARHEAGERDLPALRLAYAFHPFPLQGATIKDVSELMGHVTQTKEATYTAGSRAQLRFHAYAARQNLGTKGTDEDRFRTLGTRVQRSRAQASTLRMRTSSARIAVPFARARPVPERPLARTAGRDRVDDAHTRPVRDGAVAGTESAALAPYRSVVGERRAERLAHQAAALRPELAGRDEAWLTARRDALGEPFAALDRPGAQATLRLERDRRIVSVRLDEALEEATELEARRDELPAIRRRARRDLAEEAGTQRELASGDQARLVALAVEADTLHGQGRHLDDWWVAHAEAASQWLALGDELAAREAARDAADGASQAALVEPGVEAGLDADAPEADAGPPSALDVIDLEL